MVGEARTRTRDQWKHSQRAPLRGYVDNSTAVSRRARLECFRFTQSKTRREASATGTSLRGRTRVSHRGLGCSSPSPDGERTRRVFSRRRVITAKSAGARIPEPKHQTATVDHTCKRTVGKKEWPKHKSPNLVSSKKTARICAPACFG